LTDFDIYDVRGFTRETAREGREAPEEEDIELLELLLYGDLLKKNRTRMGLDAADGLDKSDDPKRFVLTVPRVQELPSDRDLL